MSKRASTLNLLNGSTVALVSSGFDGSTAIDTLPDLQNNGASLLQLSGANVGPDSDISVFTSTGGSNGTVTKTCRGT